MSAQQDQSLAKHLQLDMQCHINVIDLPDQEQLQHWANLAYQVNNDMPAELSLCIVDEVEMCQLNDKYRGKNRPTNVLSFPFSDSDAVMSEAIAEMRIKPLGDIVICWSVIKQEAEQQGKTVHDHTAHMVIHGVLHLCGYDHQTDQQADVMESLECTLLDSLGITNPYQ